MRASRAPGPVQSTYVQIHRQRVPKGQVERKPKKSDSAVNNVEGGCLKQFISLDDIPDFPNEDDDVWSNKKQAISYPSNNRGNAKQITQRNRHEIQDQHDEILDEEDEYYPKDNDDDEDDDNEWGNSPYAKGKSSPIVSKATPSNYDSRNNHHDSSSSSKHVQFKGSDKPISVSYHPSSGSKKSSQHDSSDEDNGDDDYIPEEINHHHQNNVQNSMKTMSSPKKPIPSISHYTTDSQRTPPPQLPCELKQKNVDEKPLTEEEKLFFSKKPRAVEYKPYTLGQYKLIKPKDYMEIGKMKPDLNTDELVAKRKNAERIKEFSSQLRSINKEVIIQQPKLPSSVEQSDLNVAKQKLDSKRTRADRKSVV